MIRVALFLAVTGAVSFGMTGCLRLFMGGAVPHSQNSDHRGQTSDPATTKDAGP